VNIIGLTGYAQHGKNTVGEVFEGLGYRPVAFADALRELATIVNPYVTPEPQKPNRYAGVVAEYGYEQAKLKGDVRRFLQDLGTGVRDIIGPNAWVQALTNKLVPGERYVITDVRFPNEAAAVTNLGGEVWRVHRPDFDNGIGTSHPSEAHIADLPCQVFLANDGGVAELQRMVKHLIGARGL
jgi:hypothetical protein